MGITKVKGDIGVTAAIYEMTKHGFNISLPIAEHLPYDLIAEKDGIPCRVQVKYVTLKKGVMIVEFRHIWYNSNGVHISNRLCGEFDLLACYCPQTEKCYFVSDKDFNNKSAVILRMEKPKASTSSPFRMMDDYVDCDVAFNSWLMMRSGEYNMDNGIDIDVDKLVESKRSGKTWEEVGFLYGISGVTARAHVKNSGVDVASLRKVSQTLAKSYDPALIDKIGIEIKSRMSSRAIAKKLGVSRYLVSKIICLIDERRVVPNGKGASC
jgi:hypothetical protein